MNEPISELICKNIFQTLKEIKKSNGYHFDLSVERQGVHENAKADLKLIIIDTLQEEIQSSQVSDFVNVNKEFIFELYLTPSESDTTPIARYFNLIKSDIQKAMYQDIYRGGYASDTNIGQDDVLLDSDGRLSGYQYVYEVSYRYRPYDATKQ